MVNACLKKNRQAQRELYDRFSGTMKGICMRYAKSEDDAEDILQESFMNVFRKLKDYEEKGSLGGWIRRITVNKAIEYYRKERSIAKHINDFQLEMSDEQTSELFQTIDLELLLKKIQGLAAGYRLVFNMHAIEGYTHREIAKELNITEGTSKSQFARAKKILQEMVNEEMRYEQIAARYVK